MKRIAILVVLAVCMPLLAHAEFRTIAVEINRAKDKSIKVTIHSEVKSEKKKDISIAEATKILKKARGWGSSVGVAIVIDGVELNNYIALVKVIAENAWLDLTVLKQKQGMGDHILKYYNIEQSPAGDVQKAAPEE